MAEKRFLLMLSEFQNEIKNLKKYFAINNKKVQSTLTRFDKLEISMIRTNKELSKIERKIKVLNKNLKHCLMIAQKSV
jgi:predicted  nucleic acid-binding Zn-ribbon protein